MHRKKTNPLKSFFSAFKRIFRARSIIIISNHKVDHLPLSGVMQILLLVGMLGLFSGVSYITGSYMSARGVIRDKDRKIASTTNEKVRIGEEMDVLKRDLVRLSQNGQELSAYSKSIVEEHANLDVPNLGAATPTAQSFGQDAEASTHIMYLEGRIKEIENENDHLVMAIRERTNKKIDVFEDIISSTGLDADKLEHMATAEIKPAGTDAAAATPGPHASPLPSNENAAVKKDTRIHGEDEGGPFIPYDSTSFNDNDRQLLANVDRMILLHDIIEQLPLAQPIADAATTGPFGKRVDPINGRWAIHPGVDLAGPLGSKIYCTSGGKVLSAGRHAAYGNMVDIDHGFGIVTRYAHMSQVLVEEGDIVKKGQQIGVEGSTGRSTGPHLHYEVRINDRPVNPEKFLEAGENVSDN